MIMASAKSWHGSSNIAEVAYEAEARRLTVTFSNGGVYRFDEFPAEAHMAFDAAPSAGKHFAAHIRGKYPSEKLEQGVA
jgi:hypothetical protein